MKIRRVRTGTGLQVQELLVGEWHPLAGESPLGPSPFSDEWELASCDRHRQATDVVLPFSPLSFRDFLLSEQHNVNASRGLVKRFYPRDYRLTKIVETLTLICEMLPGLPHDIDPWLGDLIGTATSDSNEALQSSQGRKMQQLHEKRLDLLKNCQAEVRRFALIIFPTLTDAFSSTVNLNVRQKVLTAQIKMLSNLDQSILIEALSSVPYASFLASILSQRDHVSLVMLGQKYLDVKSKGYCY